MVSLALLSSISSLAFRIKGDFSQLLAGNLALCECLLSCTNTASRDLQEVIRLVVVDVLEKCVEPVSSLVLLACMAR